MQKKKKRLLKVDEENVHVVVEQTENGYNISIIGTVTEDNFPKIVDEVFKAGVKAGAKYAWDKWVTVSLQ
jgi:hypothetical protein